MKKVFFGAMLIFALLIFLPITLSGCNTDKACESVNRLIAEIDESGNGYFICKSIKDSNSQKLLGDEFHVNTVNAYFFDADGTALNNSSFKAGDYIGINYTGEILETYPVKIRAEKITLLDKTLKEVSFGYPNMSYSESEKSVDEMYELWLLYRESSFGDKEMESPDTDKLPYTVRFKYDGNTDDTVLVFYENGMYGLEGHDGGHYFPVIDKSKDFYNKFYEKFTPKRNK